MTTDLDGGSRHEVVGDHDDYDGYVHAVVEVDRNVLMRRMHEMSTSADESDSHQIGMSLENQSYGDHDDVMKEGDSRNNRKDETEVQLLDNEFEMREDKVIE